ncbi:hypothetical protein HPB49_012360 [Dermacentor silvarum]|uniref:Uncharacterized protein n=1 Tax=Dermacentor silvarum TaxID=543639 RepID=A0ACB8CXA0_DERSI|nr:hypothetical protein HPB49_012360 [Dermacentor silvarum]
MPFGKNAAGTGGRKDAACSLEKESPTANDNMSSVLKSACEKAEAVVAALPERIQQVFDFVQEKTGVQRAYFMLGMGAFSALYLIFGYFAELLCNIVGLVYPAYASTRAIESADRNDDTRWLTYWVVYACFSILDFFADGILRFFPFYWLVKVVFLVYCFLPAALQRLGAHLQQPDSPVLPQEQRADRQRICKDGR